MKTIVVAGNFAQARNWASAKAIPGISICYIDAPEKLYGLADIDVHLVGSYMRRDDWPDISREIAARRLRVIKDD